MKTMDFSPIELHIGTHIKIFCTYSQGSVKLTDRSPFRDLSFSVWRDLKYSPQLFQVMCAFLCCFSSHVTARKPFIAILAAAFPHIPQNMFLDWRLDFPLGYQFSFLSACCQAWTAFGWGPDNPSSSYHLFFKGWIFFLFPLPQVYIQLQLDGMKE